MGNDIELTPSLKARRVLREEIDKEDAQLEQAQKATAEIRASVQRYAELSAILAGKLEILYDALGPYARKDADFLKKRVREWIELEEKDHDRLKTDQPAGWQGEVEVLDLKIKGKKIAQRVVNSALR
jgi:multidrug resistance efflux pump